MAQISDIPNEILGSILHFSAPPQRREPPWFDVDNIRVHPEPTTLFPFNLACVCRRWLAILQDVPSYWQNVYLDIISDPTPFLDVFMWSQNYPLRVAVYNTGSQADTTASMERERVQKIMESLKANIGWNSRCVSVAFRLIYATSLPSPIIFLQTNPPVLQKLILEAHINDADYTTHHPSRSMQERSYTHCGELNYMALTGSGFLQLDRLSRPWLSRLTLTSLFSLSVSGLQLSQPGSGEILPLASFSDFMDVLCALCRMKEINLTNVSLTYEPQTVRPEQRLYTLNVAIIRFEDVSQGFLREMFTRARIVKWGQQHVIGTSHTTFVRCSIPTTEIKDLRIFSDQLVLDSIPDSPAGSIINIMSIWRGSRVVVRRCPSFDLTAVTELLRRHRAENSEDLDESLPIDIDIDT